MLETLDDTTLTAILSAKCSLENKRRRLIELTNGNDDNHSAWIVQIEKGVRENGDENFVGDETTRKSNALLLEKPVAVKRKRWWQRLFGKLFP